VDKVPAGHTFLDLSDYARPFARWLVRRLLPAPIAPNHLTLAFTVAGLAAAAIFSAGRWLPGAGLLLLLKSGLDAADGALARARARPSRVGRFLDSNADFVVNLAVYGGIAWAAFRDSGQWGYFILAALALVSALLQVSLFNHYYIRYRTQTGGDRTSQLNETAAAGYAWDNPTVLRYVFGAYRAIYGWQDRLVTALDRFVSGGSQRPITPAFMTANSVLGLGTQLLVIALCAFINQPVWALWLFATVFNLYALALAASRR
jgi:phosphatidylglycerophosphate synthase